MKTTVNAKITIKNVTRVFPITIDWDVAEGPDDERAMKRSAPSSSASRIVTAPRTRVKGAGRRPSRSVTHQGATDFLIGKQTASEERDPVKIIQKQGVVQLEQLTQLAALDSQETKMSTQKG